MHKSALLRRWLWGDHRLAACHRVWQQSRVAFTNLTMTLSTTPYSYYCPSHSYYYMLQAFHYANELAQPLSVLCHKTLLGCFYSACWLHSLKSWACAASTFEARSQTSICACILQYIYIHISMPLLPSFWSLVSLLLSLVAVMVCVGVLVGTKTGTVGGSGRGVQW